MLQVISTYIQGTSQTSYTTPCNGVVSHGFKLGVFRFSSLPTTHAKTDTKQMRSRSLYTVRCFTCVHLHAQIAVDAGDICTWQTTVILITGKPRIPPIWATCWDENGAGCGISLVYLWVIANFIDFFIKFIFLFCLCIRPKKKYKSVSCSRSENCNAECVFFFFFYNSWKSNAQ